MLYTKTNEYLLENGDCFLVGMTDYALENLGDIIFIELPEVGNKFKKNEVIIITFFTQKLLQQLNQ